MYIALKILRNKEVISWRRRRYWKQTETHGNLMIRRKFKIWITSGDINSTAISNFGAWLALALGEGVVLKNIGVVLKSFSVVTKLKILQACGTLSDYIEQGYLLHKSGAEFSVLLLPRPSHRKLLLDLLSPASLWYRCIKDRHLWRPTQISRHKAIYGRRKLFANYSFNLWTQFVKLCSYPIPVYYLYFISLTSR